MQRPSSAVIAFSISLVGASLAIVACGGGKTITTPVGTVAAQTTPTPTAGPTATPMTAAPAAVQTTVPLVPNASGPAISMPLPAPSGYSSNVTIPIVSAPTGTIFALVSSLTLPTALPVLQAKSRVSRTVRVPQAAGNLAPIFFDSFVPSNAVTVAGNVSFSQAFPQGTLSTATQYYLGFYDSTQPSPSWQTIEGPVTTPDGITLTFGGNVKAFTFQASQLYGFAVFSLVSAAATPPPAPQTIAFFENNSGGIDEYTETGTKIATLAIPARTFGMDDSGNIYAAVLPTAIPNAAPTPTAVPTIARYPYGSTSPAAVLMPTADTILSPCCYVAGVSGAGEAAVMYLTTEYGPNGLAAQETDVWTPGATGGPSYSLGAQVAGFNSLVGHDGTIYVQGITPAGLSVISVYPPGAFLPARTIMEQLVPPAQQSTFTPNYGTVGPDGTVYLTEYSFTQPDPLSGLYIYHPDGTETFVLTTGATGGTPGSVTGDPGAEGVDVDGAGNIYVANSNFNIMTSPPYGAVADTLNDVEVFSPGGKSVLRHITGLTSPVTIAVASDGTAFISDYSLAGTPPGTFVVQAGAGTATQITNYSANSMVLYDGNRATTGKMRATTALGAGVSHGGSSALSARLATIRKRRHL